MSWPWILYIGGQELALCPFSVASLAMQLYSVLIGWQVCVLCEERRKDGGGGGGEGGGRGGGLLYMECILVTTLSLRYGRICCSYSMKVWLL